MNFRQPKILKLRNIALYKTVVIVFTLLGIFSAFGLLTSGVNSRVSLMSYVLFCLCLIAITLGGIGWINYYLDSHVSNPSLNDNGFYVEQNEIDFLITRLRHYKFRRLCLAVLMTVFYGILSYFIWLSLSIDPSHALGLKLLLIIPLVLFELTFIWSLLWWPWEIRKHLRTPEGDDLVKLRVTGSIDFHKHRKWSVPGLLKLQPRSFNVGPNVFQNCFAISSSPDLDDIASHVTTIEFCSLLPHVPIKVLHGENIVYDQTEPEKYSEMVIGDDKDEIRI